MHALPPPLLGTDLVVVRVVFSLLFSQGALQGRNVDAEVSGGAQLHVLHQVDLQWPERGWSGLVTGAKKTLSHTHTHSGLPLPLTFWRDGSGNSHIALWRKSSLELVWSPAALWPVVERRVESIQ